MAEQEFKQPSRRRHDDSESEPHAIPTTPNAKSSSVSSNAQGTINSIDDALEANKNIHPAGPTGRSIGSSEAEGPGTTSGGIGNAEHRASKGPEGVAGTANKVKNAASFAYNPEGAAARAIGDRFKQFFWGGKKEKRRTLIGGATGVGVIILGIFFLATLPNELVALTTDLQNHLFSGVEADVSKESDRLVSDYLDSRMRKTLGLQCKNLRDCIQTGKKTFGNCKDDDNICKLFSKWDDSDLAGQFEGKGVTFTKEGGRWYIVSDEIPDGKLDVTEALQDKNTNLFDYVEQKIPGFGETLKTIKDSLVVATGSYLHNIFTRLFPWTRFDGDGLGSREKDASQLTEEEKQNAFEENDTGEVVDTAYDTVAADSAEKGLTGEDPTANRTDPGVDAAQDMTGGKPVSPLETQVNQDEVAAASKFLGSTKLGDLLTQYKDLKAKGINALADSVANAIGGVTGADVSKEMVAQVIDKLGGAIAIVQISFTVLNFVHHVGTTLKALYFMVHYYPYVSRAVEAQSEADKQKSGCNDAPPLANGAVQCQNDLTMVGSFVTAMHANGSTAGGSCYVNYVINGNNDTDTAAQVHTCLKAKNMALNDYNNPITQLSSFANSMPFFGPLLSFVTVLNDIVGAILFLPNLIITAIIHATGLDAVIGKIASAVLWWIVYHALPVGGLLEPSGADLGSTIGIGTHLEAWTAGDAIGGKRLTPAQSAQLGNIQLNAEQRAFQHQPLFARLFSKNTPYSFASQLSMKIPTNVDTLAQSSFASLIQNPLGKLFGSFASVLRPGNVFAAATPAASPDGVWDNGLPPTDAVFNTDSETFQNNNNCVQQSKQDYPDWNKHVATDPDTGQIYHTQTNGCLLQQRTMEAMGALSGYSD